MSSLQTFLLAAVIGLLPAFIARHKGRNFLLWWFFGAGLFILALPAALMMKSTVTDGRLTTTNAPTPEAPTAGADGDRRPCPHCAESIKVEARFCRFCQLEVTPVASHS